MGHRSPPTQPPQKNQLNTYRLSNWLKINLDRVKLLNIGTFLWQSLTEVGLKIFVENLQPDG